LVQIQAEPHVRASVPGERPLVDLLADVLVAGQGLRAFLDESAKNSGQPLDALVSDDDNLYLEYATPRSNVLPWSTRDELVASIRRHRSETDVAALLAP